MIIDLRSDTVVKPTPAMRAAMASAEVGDDVFGEDPTVNALEERLAALFGHEAALFCPSGTMTNQIAIHVHTRPGDEVICEEGAHIYRYEGGGTMATSGCSVRFVPAERGRFTAGAVESAMNDPENPHLPRTRLVVVENTSNRGGGATWPIRTLPAIRSTCDTHRLALHMDGARIFNAMAADGTKPREWGAIFHSISICLSKGLGAPVGSVLTGTTPFIREARRVRKRLGGGMRQAGVLAAAGLHALDHHVDRLQEDHARATRLGEALRAHPAVEMVMPVETNIIIYTLRNGIAAAEHVARLAASGVRCIAIGPRQIRMVTHLEVDDQAVDRSIAILQQL